MSSTITVYQKIQEVGIPLVGRDLTLRPYQEFSVPIELSLNGTLDLVRVNLIEVFDGDLDLSIPIYRLKDYQLLDEELESPTSRYTNQD
jgi:hypothetical protein